jgi:hypothetical protein
LYSVNLRLPHTPRSFPQAAAAHYFDDVFSKKGKKASASAPALRRSSTTRSIGNRSEVQSTNGDESAADNEDAVPDETADNSADEIATRAQLEHDEHVQKYVNDQLERVRSGGSADNVHDEFEASLDGA